jgi:ferredoxin-NADP reductase
MLTRAWSARSAFDDASLVRRATRSTPPWDVWVDPPNGSPTDWNIVLRVAAIEQDSPSCTSIHFERPRGFTYEAGDWVDLRFPTPDLAVGRTFSFSSSPTEDRIRITYKHGVSPFKRAVAAVQPGQELLVTQSGSNGFRLSDRHPAVMIAGGVGIAPFRSMVQAAIDTRTLRAIDVVFVSRGGDIPFRAEMATWASGIPHLRLHDIHTGSGARLGAATLRPIVDGAEAERPKYYIAGPPAMVDATLGHLVAMGLDKDQILTDRFDGYA